MVSVAPIHAASSTAQPTQPPRRGLVLAGRGQPVEAERPQRLQHPVPGAAPANVGVDHGGVDEAGQHGARDRRPGPGRRRAARRCRGRRRRRRPTGAGTAAARRPRAARRTTRRWRAASGAGRRRRAGRRRADRASGRAGGAGRRGRRWTAGRRRARWPAASRRAAGRCRRPVAGPRVSARRRGGPGAARSRKTATDGTSGEIPARDRAAASGASRKAYSAASPSGSRLVASTVSRGQAGQDTSTVSRTASSRCSQLSITSRPRPVAQDGDAGREHVALHDAQVQRRRQRVRDGGRVGDRGEQQHGRRVARAAATSRATRVLPDPARPDDRDQPLASRAAGAAPRPRASRPNSRVVGRAGALGPRRRPDRRPRRRCRVRARRAPATGRGRSRRPAGAGTPGRRAAPRRPARSPPARASAAAPPARAAGRRRSAAAASPTTSSARPAPTAAAIRASVTSRCSCAQPSTAAAIGATSVRSASTGPRHSACASLQQRRTRRRSARARAAQQRAAPARRPARRRRGRAGSRPWRVCSRAAAGPRCARSRETWVCRACRPDSGTSAGHSASTRWSTVTVRPSASASSASTARRLGPRHLDRRAVDRPAAAARAPPPARVRLAHASHLRATACRVRLSARRQHVHVPATARRDRSLAGTSRRREGDRTMDHDKVKEFLGRFVDRPGRHRRRRPGGDRPPARALPGARRGPGDRRAVRRAHRLPPRATSPSGCAARPPAGYVTYDPATGEFSLTEEQAFCLADPNGPNLLGGVPSPCSATCAPSRSITEAFRTGDGRRLARARRGRLRRLRRVLPARLRRRAGAELDPGAGRGRRRS